MSGPLSDQSWPGPQPCDCGEDFPLYGVAPHECYWRKGPEFTIGQSTLIPITEDACFVPDLEDGEDWSAFVYPSATGVYYCPVCQHERYTAAWERLTDRIGPPPPEVHADECHHQLIESIGGGNGR